MGSSMMADPIIALLKFQDTINAGGPVDPEVLNEGYAILPDEINGGIRNSFAKIVDGEVQAMSIFGLVDPIDGLHCFNVGYAVKESCRGRGLAVEAVNKGIKELSKSFVNAGVRRFYIDALIDAKNIHSLNVAKRLFSNLGVPAIDESTGTPSFYFKRLIVIQ
jgi:hypothetical protein